MRQSHLPIRFVPLINTGHLASTVVPSIVPFYRHAKSDRYPAAFVSAPGFSGGLSRSLLFPRWYNCLPPSYMEQSLMTWINIQTIRENLDAAQVLVRYSFDVKLRATFKTLSHAWKGSVLTSRRNCVWQRSWSVKYSRLMVGRVLIPQSISQRQRLDLM